MNLESFIANRIAFSQQNSFTKTIIRFAIACVALSITVVILTTAVITGFKNQITEKIFGFWGHIEVTHHNITRSFDAIPIVNDAPYIDSIKAIDRAIVNYYSDDEGDETIITMKSQQGVRHVQSSAILPGIIKTKEEFDRIIVKGIGTDFDWKNLSQFLIAGSPIEFMDNGEASDDILISEETSKRMNLELDQFVLIYFLKDREQIKRRFKVKGIYKTGLQEYDEYFVLADIKEIQKVLGWDENQVMAMEVFVDDIDDVEVINEHIYTDIVPGQLYLYSKPIRQKFPEIFSWLDLQNINEYVILSLMIIVSIINMITALLILILERTQMIGILKSLGSSDWSVRKIFLYQAFHILKWGLIIGNIVGLGLCLLQQHFQIIKLNEENYYLSSAPIEINLFHILILNIVSILIILVFLIIPTLLVSRISPVKVLHFK